MSLDEPNIARTDGNTEISTIESGSVLHVVDDNFTLVGVCMYVCMYKYMSLSGITLNTVVPQLSGPWLSEHSAIRKCHNQNITIS